MTKRSKESLHKSVILQVASDEEVQWRWSLLSQCIDCENDAAELLEELIKLWVIIRGFAIVV